MGIEAKWSRKAGSRKFYFQVLQKLFEVTAAVRVVPRVIKEANKEKHYTVDAEYPQIEGDQRFDSFNREAKALITKDVAAFKTEENAQESEAGSPTPSENQDSTLDIRYEI